MNDEDPVKKGRGHPPKEHQWRKGVSGNPYGRPLGSKNRKKPQGRTPAEQIALEESNRLITTSDGEMTAFRAVLRSQHVQAIKGGSNAARDAITRALKLEQEQDQHESETLAKWEEYKLLYEEVRMFAPKGFSRIEPLLLPHPDDVVVDFRNRSVQILGPANTKERKEWREAMAALRTLRIKTLSYRRQVAADPTNADLNLKLFRFMDRFEKLNAKMPERYRLHRLPIWTKGRELPFPELSKRTR